MKKIHLLSLSVKPLTIIMSLFIITLLVSNAYFIKQVMTYKTSPTPQATPNQDDPYTKPVLKPHELTNVYYQVKKQERAVHFVQRHAEKDLELLASIPLIENGPLSATLAGSDKIIYVDGDYNLKQYDITKDKHTVIATKTTTPGKVAGYNFINVLASPDGESLLVGLGYYEGAGSTAIMHSDGTHFEIINSVTAGDYDWSYNSKQFVIGNSYSDFGGDSAKLYLASTDKPQEGKQLFPLNTNKKEPDNYKDAETPQFSPDGTRLAFSYRYLDYAREDDGSQFTEAPHHREVYIVNTDGSNFRQVTNHTQFTLGPIWKDNQTLLYALNNYYSGKNHGYYTVNLATGNSTLLTSSYDGLPLAFSTDKTSFLAYANGPTLSYDPTPNDLPLVLVTIGKSDQEFIDYSRNVCFGICSDDHRDDFLLTESPSPTLSP